MNDAPIAPPADPATLRNAAGVAVHRSRWGYHPVDREAFLRMKERHREELEVFRGLCAYHRWWRRHERNRGERPRLTPAAAEYVARFPDLDAAKLAGARRF
jgi:hypothetical protein